jgi:hypothetical protein
VATRLSELIAEHREPLTDRIVKDAICQIPSYAGAPLRQTMDGVGRWLTALASSLERNDPHVLEQFLAAVGQERQEEGYPVGELHGIVQSTERHLSDLIRSVCTQEVDCNANLALLGTVMESTRMVLSVTYILSAGRRPSL